jgi:hypothetical protein
MVGIKGSNERGSIALDDISFLESGCGISPSEVITELTTTASTPLLTTSLRSSNTEINCNFDENYKCGWFDDVNSELTWTLNKGSTAKAGTGPATDVSGSGYYIYLETVGVKEGNKARLLSPVINSTISKNPRKILSI